MPFPRAVGHFREEDALLFGRDLQEFVGIMDPSDILSASDAPTRALVAVCVIAAIAWLINRWKKLPRAVFIFLVVTIVCAVCWYAFRREVVIGNVDSVEKSVTQKTAEKKAAAHVPEVFIEAVRDVALPPGETRFSLPVFVAGKRKHDCVRFVLGTDDASLTEQAFVDKVHFSLLFGDGTLVPASGISFGASDGAAFPQKFILKVFFVPPESAETLADADAAAVRCVAENGTNSVFKIAEISVGARPEETPDADAGTSASEGAK